ILAPDHERWRLIGTKIGVPLRIPRRIGAIIVEQLQLDGLVARAILHRLIDEPIIGTDGLGVAHPVGILPLRGLEGQELLQWRSVLFSAVLPVGTERLPELAESLRIRVTILDDQGLDALRVLDR